MGLAGCGGELHSGSTASELAPALAAPTFALCALEDLSLERSGDTFTFYEATRSRGTFAHVGANRDLLIGQDTHVGGHAIAGGNLTVRGGAAIDRSAVHGGTADIARRAVVGEGSRQQLPAPEPCQALDLDPLFAAAALENDNATLAADPNIAPYLVGGGLELPDQVSIVMPAGVYHFSHLVLGENARIEVVGRDVVHAFVTGAIQLGRGAQIETHPHQQTFWLLGSSYQPIDLPSRSTAAAHLYAPRAEVRMESRSRVLGSVLARTITLASGARVRFVGLETADP